MSLENYTENQLRDEIARRERERKTLESIQVVIDKTPAQEVENRLVNLGKMYLRDELDDREIDTRWAYEELMEIVYGKGVFDKLCQLRR
ncbi:hypothetical protein VPFG_00277 [Vibrio phage nt-1]|uniref:Uncharacterized protein n=1 Tax=Vibrio phage nt-1 TaxID=115992 RepID=R9TER3_9CAUD|nr:hypothetical protein VPFG_00277 [Vibrio phage nt-1]AGN30276.1 hypothetical protein VPFG_00277 [Vibrio phage nt-1]